MLFANNAKWFQIEVILDKKTKKQWGGIGEKDSIVPAGVQLNLHLPCAAKCGRQYHSVEFTPGSFELMCRAAGTRQEAGA